MKIKYFSVTMLIFAISFLSCVSRTQQSNEISNNDTILNVKESINIDKEKVVSLIKEDEEKRCIWSYDFKESQSSPLFYEAICDDGLYLYRVTLQNQQTYVIMVEDENIGATEDYIEYSAQCGNNGLGYEHKGYYEIIDDTTVNVYFEKTWKNYCMTCDSSEQEFTYHIKCVHSYKFSNLAFERIKADTIVMIDERDLFIGDEIKKYIY